MWTQQMQTLWSASLLEGSLLKSPRRAGTPVFSSKFAQKPQAPMFGTSVSEAVWKFSTDFFNIFTLKWTYAETWEMV